MEMLEIYKSVCIGWMYQKHINYEMNETDSSQTKLSLAKLQANEWMTKNTNNNGLSPSLSSIMWPNWRLLSYLSWCVSLVHFLSPLHISLLTPSLPPLLGKRMCHHRIIYRHWMANDIKLWIDAKRVSGWAREKALDVKSTESSMHIELSSVSVAHISERVYILKYSRFKSFFHFKMPSLSPPLLPPSPSSASSQCVNHFTLLLFCSIFFDMI